MIETDQENLKIFQISILKRGLDLGSLKIIARSARKAFAIAHDVLNKNQQLNPQLISFQVLQVLPLTYKGPAQTVLSKRGVI